MLIADMKKAPDIKRYIICHWITLYHPKATHKMLQISICAWMIMKTPAIFGTQYHQQWLILVCQFWNMQNSIISQNNNHNITVNLDMANPKSHALYHQVFAWPNSSPGHSYHMCSGMLLIAVIPMMLTDVHLSRNCACEMKTNSVKYTYIE